MNTINLKQIRKELIKNYVNLQGQEVSYNGDTPLHLYNQKRDYKKAILLLEAKLKDESFDEMWLKKIAPFMLNPTFFQGVLCDQWIVYPTKHGHKIHLSTQTMPIGVRPRPVILRPNLKIQTLLGRSHEIKAATTILKSGQSISFFGPVGTGKTALLHHIIHQIPTTTFADGIIYQDITNKTLNQVFETIFDSFYQTDIPYQCSEQQIKPYFFSLQALIALDNVSLASTEISILMDSLPNCTFLFSSHAEIMHSYRYTKRLTGFSIEEGLKFIKQQLATVNKKLSHEEKIIAKSICATFRGSPQHLWQLISYIQTSNESLAKVAFDLQKGIPTDILAIKLISSLSEPEKEVINVLAAIDGCSLSLEHIGIIADIANPSNVLQSLLKQNIVTLNNNRYSLVKQFILILKQSTFLRPWVKRALQYFKRWVTDHQDNPKQLIAEQEIIYLLIKWAGEAECWLDILELTYLIEKALLINKQWHNRQQVMQYALLAAIKLNDKATQAWVLHELGTQALCLGNFNMASDYFTQSLKLQQPLKNKHKIKLTQHNFSFIFNSEPNPSKIESRPIKAVTQSQSSSFNWPKNVLAFFLG